MFGWLQAARRLAELGILGINRRNASYILDYNDRALFPLVDDKLRMRDLCVQIGVPTPAIHDVITSFGELRSLGQRLQRLSDFVIKPNHGSAGRGVLVLMGREGERWLRHNGESISLEQLRQHLSEILSGLYSLGGHPDQALVQQRVRLHPDFAPLTFKGIPDIRVIVYRCQVAMAMLRLPTRRSGGRANLHQGGIGAGVDLDTGLTNHAVSCNRFVEAHPDTGASVVGFRVPCWKEVLEMSQRVAAAVGLGYLGVDIVVDDKEGPLLLEANARPGLAIQSANGFGLLPRLRAIDEQIRRTSQRATVCRQKTVAMRQRKAKIRKSA